MPEPRIQRFGPHQPTPSVAQELLRDGVVILEDLLPREAVDGLNAELAPHFESSRPGAFLAAGNSSVGGVWGLHAMFSEQPLRQRVLELADAHYWLAQAENQYLAAPPEFARTLPLEAIQLLGYRAGVHGNYLQGRKSENLLEPDGDGPG